MISASSGNHLLSLFGLKPGYPLRYGTAFSPPTVFAALLPSYSIIIMLASVSCLIVASLSFPSYLIFASGIQFYCQRLNRVSVSLGFITEGLHCHCETLIKSLIASL